MVTKSILQRVRLHAQSQPDRPAFVFVRRHNGEGEILTWFELWQGAAAIANSLPGQVASSGEGIMILCNDEKNFVLSLLAIWMRGAVAIPGCGAWGRSQVERNRHIFARGRPDYVLHDQPISGNDDLAALAKSADFLEVNSLKPVTSPDLAEPVEGAGGLLQFTSGSTSKPKGVLLSDDEIAANCSLIEQEFSLSTSSVGVHWLPLFHDMGLVGSVMEPFWVGCTSVILSPGIFIQRPVVWLQQITQWRGTITSAPNFAYERLCDALDARELEDVDLSSLENVIFGGEPVAERTVERLLGRFSQHGLSPDAIAPSYGMAEATLLVSSGKRTGGPLFCSDHREVPVACLGPIGEGLQVTVRDVETGIPCADGSPGEIWIQGDSVGMIVTEDDNWRLAGSRSKEPVHTGDYGYIKDGQLYVTARDANKIIIRGRNIFAEDVEALARQSQQEGVVSGIAAVGLDNQGSESLCILIEQAKRGADLNIIELNRTISSVLGVKLAEVVVLRSGTLPRTSSGKIRHRIARDAFVAGDYLKRTIEHVRQAGL